MRFIFNWGNLHQMADKQTHTTKTVIDLFAGAGGLSLGLFQARWKGPFTYEINAFENIINTTNDNSIVCDIEKF